MKSLRSLAIFSILFLFLYLSANSTEPSHFEVSPSAAGSRNMVNSEKSAMADICPPLLKKWVDDDFSDVKSWGFKYKSEAKVCQSQIQTYLDIISKKKKLDSSLDEPKKLNDFFSKKFSKQINSAYKDSLSKCQDLPPEKANAVYTRFYSAGTKLEAANSSIIEEVSYIDSVLPNSKVPITNTVLNGIDCRVPIWPGLKDKCEALTTSYSGCSSQELTKKRFDDLIKKTQKNLPEIEGLVISQHNCINKITAESGSNPGRSPSKETQQKIKDACDPISAALEIKRNEIPWIRGKEFQKIAIKKKPSPRNYIFTTEYDLSDETLQKAVSQQLTHNRNTLSATYKSNLDDFRCLSEKTITEEACNFEKIRTHLQQLPDVRDSLISSKTTSDAEAKIYIEADSCLLERHEDRAKTKASVDGAMEGIVITAATFGLGEIVAGVRAANAMSKMTRFRQGLLASTVGVNATLTGHGLKNAYETCSAETKSVISLSKTANLIKENVCSDRNSALAQAKELENDCMVTALLTAPSVLPFVGAIPALKTLIKDFKSRKNATLAAETSISKGPVESADLGANLGGREKELQQFSEKVKARGRNNRDLEFASNLTMEERYKVAEEITGKALTESQKKALKSVHEDGGGYNFDSKSELTRNRDKILQEGGFSKKESAILRGNGIAGSWWSKGGGRNKTWEEVVEDGFLGQTASIPRSDGSWSKAKIVRVLKRDSNGKASEVVVEWSENGRPFGKTIELYKIKIDYEVGQKVYFGRTNGGFTQGTIFSKHIDKQTGQEMYTVTWNENGRDLLKEVEVNSVHHVPPYNSGSSGGQKNAGGNRQNSGNRNGNGNDNYEPPPRPETSPKQDPIEAKFNAADKINPARENKINYESDRSSLLGLAKAQSRIGDINVNNNNRDETRRFIQTAVGLNSESTNADILKKITTLQIKFHPDKSPDYKEVADSAMQSLSQMKEFIKQLERESSSFP